MSDLLAIADEFQRAAAKARAGIPTIVGQMIGQVLVADVREQFYQGHDAEGRPFAPLKFTRPQGGNKPLLNTAVLANSYTAVVDARGASVGSNHIAAALHQHGGVIRPVRAKVLVRPLTAEAARYASPRRFPRPLFVAMGGLVERVGAGKRAKLVRHYAFMRSATIPARPVGFSKQAEQDAAELVMDYYGVVP